MAFLSGSVPAINITGFVDLDPEHWYSYLDYDKILVLLEFLFHRFYFLLGKIGASSRTRSSAEQRGLASVAPGQFSSRRRRTIRLVWTLSWTRPRGRASAVTRRIGARRTGRDDIFFPTKSVFTLKEISICSVKECA
jgi:hypothetical protein